MEYYIIACCFLLWLGISYWGYTLAREKWRVIFFKSTSGIVTNVGTRTEATIAIEAGDSKELTFLIFKYHFSVDGQKYKGSHEGGSFEYVTDENGKKQILKSEYSKGDQVRVYYNPKNPKDNSHTRWDFIGALVFIGIGQLFLLLAINLIKKWL